ncbi:MAG TPA: cobyric acid synthase [Candidatus Syntrophoarchaeum butanivorans]|uniref:Probable cobyric acid synthase n=1 Tax=Candidatus Syntropharchaeum butanivorans TaxID=1839936 RepID=A0A7C1B2F7_9EURY|nr:cobyric acid synthase [Candidatus Syntrophoarchaeum butanivorans]
MKALMVQGTSSHAGKTILVAALCRILSDMGYRVTPFKSQNMSLNSYVTDGGEIAYAEAVQAWAAREEPRVDMNPILLKPKGEGISQVIVHGKPYKDLNVRDYYDFAEKEGIKAVKESYERLSKEYDLCIIEGAGSPAEINIRHDISNMRIARMADAPVILIADIERGGVFASIIGTIDLLGEESRRVAGTVINKFRGDPSLLDPGIEYLEKRTGIPNLGVIPYVRIDVPVEDSVSIDQLVSYGGVVDVAVIRLPYVSVFTDIEPLLMEEGVGVRWVSRCEELGSPDLVIIPGSKNTIHDMAFLNQSGIADRIRDLAADGIGIIGICGGYQMLGDEIIDYGIEGGPEERRVEGLGLLRLKTEFKRYNKIVRRVRAKISDRGGMLRGGEVTGYEIHMGVTGGDEEVAFMADCPLGHVNREGNVIGTYIHGVFDETSFRGSVLDHLFEIKGALPSEHPDLNRFREEGFKKLAEVMRKHLDLDRVLEILGVG